MDAAQIYLKVHNFNFKWQKSEARTVGLGLEGGLGRRSGRRRRRVVERGQELGQGRVGVGVDGVVVLGDVANLDRGGRVGDLVEKPDGLLAAAGGGHAADQVLQSSLLGLGVNLLKSGNHFVTSDFHKKTDRNISRV